MSYDHYKTTNPADEFLGPAPAREDIPPYTTDFWKKPIPTRNFDWTAVLSDYDGAEDAGFQPVGYGSTEQEAIDDLLQLVEDAS